jgi:predicted ATP-dependent protease
MLKKEVIDAVKENKFKIWAVDSIDDGIEVLTGIKSGTIEEEGSINWLVNKTISEYSKKLKEFSFEEKIDQKTNSTNHLLSNGVMK